MNQFPEFMRKSCNKVKLSIQSGEMEGHVFEGSDESQMVIWQSREGGRSETHTHDYDEYCVVVQGTFVGKVGQEMVTLGPGDECFIPAGVPHEGVYSTNYRAIDAFDGRRVERERVEKK